MLLGAAPALVRSAPSVAGQSISAQFSVHAYMSSVQCTCIYASYIYEYHQDAFFLFLYFLRISNIVKECYMSANNIMTECSQGLIRVLRPIIQMRGPRIVGPLIL